MSDQKEEYKDVNLDEIDTKEGELEMVFEMKLEKKSRFLRLWKPYTVKIIKETNSICIEKSDDFPSTVGINELPLSKCAVSFVTEKDWKNETVIQIMVLKYENKNTSLRREFRLPSKNQETDSQKFKLFAATLMHFGTQFDKLKSCLEKWNKQNNTFDVPAKHISLKKLSKPEIIEIFKIKYEYDMYMNKHSISKYIHMIENMDVDFIKPLQTMLNLDQFRQKEPEEWAKRCKKALEIEHEWRLLLHQIRIQMDSIAKASSLSGKLNSNPYDKIRQYQSIQHNLKKLISDMKEFADKYMIPELFEWKNLYEKYKDNLGDKTSSNYWKWIIFGMLGVAACAIIAVCIVCPPAGAGTAATTGAATVATETGVVATEWGVGSIMGLVGASAFGVGGLAAIGYGMFLYQNLPEYYWIHKDVGEVAKLWKKFRDSYLLVNNDVRSIASKGIVQDGPGWQYDAHLIAASEYVKQNIKDIEQMCERCVARIEKC